MTTSSCRRKLIADAYQRAESLLRDHSEQLEQMSLALLQRETLNYDDVVALLGEPPHKKKNVISPAEFEAQLRQEARDD